MSASAPTRDDIREAAAADDDQRVAELVEAFINTRFREARFEPGLNGIHVQWENPQTTLDDPFIDAFFEHHPAGDLGPGQEAFFDRHPFVSTAFRDANGNWVNLDWVEPRASDDLYDEVRARFEPFIGSQVAQQAQVEAAIEHLFDEVLPAPARDVLERSQREVSGPLSADEVRRRLGRIAERINVTPDESRFVGEEGPQQVVFDFDLKNVAVPAFASSIVYDTATGEVTEGTIRAGFADRVLKRSARAALEDDIVDAVRATDPPMPNWTLDLGDFENARPHLRFTRRVDVRDLLDWLPDFVTAVKSLDVFD